MQRWDYVTEEYQKHIVPANWDCAVFKPSMDDTVQCAHCGKTIKFGDGYTSLEIHNQIGFGYSVCKECYDKEWARRRAADLAKRKQCEEVE